MKPVRLRRSKLTPAAILDALMAQSSGSRIKPTIIPATIARCVAPKDALDAHNRLSALGLDCADQQLLRDAMHRRRECDTYELRKPYSGLKAHYCTRAGVDCMWRREDWKQSPVPVIEPGHGPVRYSYDRETAELRKEIDTALVTASLRDDDLGATARAYLFDAWSEVDATAGKRGLVEHRMASQEALALHISEGMERA